MEKPVSTAPKPAELSGRVHEWRVLDRFVRLPDDGARLGLVYGRRRQGKTFMLDLLSGSTDGFMFTAAQQSSAQNLRMLGAAYARYLGIGDPVSFSSWEAAFDALLRLGERRDEPTVVVLDEFPFLMDTEPSLPSLLQIGLGPTARAFRSGKTRLILCGSALTTMRRLLIGSAPLRGRAVLELVVPPFSFREAAAFWSNSDDPDLAFRQRTAGWHSRLQGDEWRRPDVFRLRRMGSRRPAGPGVRPLPRGQRAALRAARVDRSRYLHFSVLGAVANGAAKRSEIAGILGRPDTALGHPLTARRSCSCWPAARTPCAGGAPCSGSASLSSAFTTS